MHVENEKIVRVDIESQMKTSFIDYAMSVIVSRALPDVKDGFKPVHRRILYSMNELGLVHSSPYKKCATIVGDVLGKYHPHGDRSVYDALVRLAQAWSMRYTLVDGQGNFGSIDGDSPAAYRYTEARLERIAGELLADIDKDTVDFQNNFDDSRKEPVVLPTRIPNLLVNGAAGIAVGMATNMAPHNLTEAINACIAFIDNNDITTDELMQHIKAPDFPGGGVIYGYDGVREAYETGRGRVVLRAETTIEEDHKGRPVIVAHTIPYMVNKAEMVKRQAELVKEGKIDGISDIRDESDKSGIRVVYQLKHDAVAKVVLNKLYQYTELQSSFSINNIALVNGRPVLLNLKDLINHFVDHRIDVVTRRTRFELAKAEERAHIVEGLLKALDVIDEVIAIIRASETVEEARNSLMERFDFTDVQTRYIVEMRLRQLANMEREKLQEEFDELQKLIARCKEILNDHNVLMGVIKDELAETREKFGDERRTRIEYASSNFRIEDTIPDHDVVITISHLGYVKRTLLSEYRIQNRGGVGAKGSSVRNEDFVEHIFTATNHNYLLFFTEKGKCFWLRAFEIPEGARDSKGRTIQNLISIDPDDKVKAYVNVLNLSDEDYLKNNYIMLCTKNGIIKKTTLEAYSRPRQNGIIAVTVRDGDELLEAKLTNGNNEVLLASKAGKVVRFNENTVRPMGRGASGVKGINLDTEGNEVIGMLCVENDSYNILVVSEKGYGKRSELAEYRITNRGGKGVKTINITEKTGQLVAIANVTDENDLMIINKSGVLIRMRVADLRVMGRNTQGVRLINLRGNDSIASITKVEHSEDEEPEENVVADAEAMENPETENNTESAETEAKE
ncbi:MAG: DNA gyrase subunit A [Bacteroidales bacterium]|nr:DNA gyrase subunit A [Bacteroidales bacterium]